MQIGVTKRMMSCLKARLAQRNMRRFFGVIAVVWLILLGAVVFGEDASSTYRLGPEDVITFTVMGHQEFSGEFLIPSDGLLNLPAIGAIEAAGMTLDELTARSTERLKARLVKPEVTVALRTPRMQRIYVLGAVKSPGQYDMKQGWRIAEALAAAGGLSLGEEPADCDAIILRSSTGKKSIGKLEDVIRGDNEANLPLQSGDVLTIDSGEVIPIYVMGRVKDPGLYKVRQTEAGVMKAIALAGGTMEDAAISAVCITHLSGESETVDLTSAITDGKPAMDTGLQSGDMVLVPETKARIAVLGYVMSPGFYTLKDGEKLMLTDALGLAKGVDNKRGEMGSIAVVRTENGKQQKIVYDLGLFLNRGDLSQNPEIKPGDVVFVAETRKPDWSTVLQTAATIGILLR